MRSRRWRRGDELIPPPFPVFSCKGVFRLSRLQGPKDAKPKGKERSSSLDPKILELVLQALEEPSIEKSVELFLAARLVKIARGRGAGSVG